jgi:hypothetical protein
MSDCMNAEMRDLLPDLAAERLSGAERTRVASHVASCPACAAELELLSAARQVMSRGVPAVDVARIVAALPKPPVAAEATPALVPSSTPARAGISARGGQRDERLRAPSRRIGSYTSPWTAWRIAAVSMVAVGGLTVAVIRHLSSAPLINTVADSTVAQTVAPVQPAVPPAAMPTATPPSDVSQGPAQPSATHPQNPTGGSGAEDGAPGLAVASDISELSDGEVQSLLQDMNGLDDELPADPDAAVPALPTETTP